MKNFTAKPGQRLCKGFVLTCLLILCFLTGPTLGLGQENNPDDRPQWTRQTTFNKDGHLYFTGGFLSGRDYSLTIRCAHAEALKVAAQSISQYIRSVFSMYIQGVNSGSAGAERFIEDGIATFVNNLHLQGVRQKEVYFEESPAGTDHPTYNVFVMLEITNSDYMRAKAAVLEQLKKRFESTGETEAKEKAEKLLDELKTGVGDSA